MILFICFNFVLNKPIPIQNLETVTFQKGITEYVYQFSEPILQDGKDAYFFFKFSYNYKITLTIRDEDNKEQSININSYKIYYIYKIQNLKPQKYIFVVKHENSIFMSMTFIDNSREINILSEYLLNFNFDTETIKEKPPLPLIFNLELMEENLYIYFDSNYEKDNIYDDGNSKLEYCEINENECNFKGNKTNIILEKLESNIFIL